MISRREVIVDIIAAFTFSLASGGGEVALFALPSAPYAWWLMWIIHRAQIATDLSTPTGYLVEARKLRFVTGKPYQLRELTQAWYVRLWMVMDGSPKLSSLCLLSDEPEPIEPGEVNGPAVFDIL